MARRRKKNPSARTLLIVGGGGAALYLLVLKPHLDALQAARFAQLGPAAPKPSLLADLFTIGTAVIEQRRQEGQRTKPLSEFMRDPRSQSPNLRQQIQRGAASRQFGSQLSRR